METRYRFGIIGCGLIGQKRAEAIRALGLPLLAVADVSTEKANGLASKYGATALSADALIDHPEINCIVVATANYAAPELTNRALAKGKHVLVEKPAGRNPKELQSICEAEKKAKGTICRIGFNHRFHPAVFKAKQLLDGGAIGPLMFFRARYGHGGRTGYDREWRADPKLSGGGELLDQGVHLIDLCRWMGGEFDLETGRVFTFFWDMPVEDNGFLLLKSPDGSRVAHLHASCTEWKNMFDFEIFGKTGKIQVTGLGRSYGPEELRIYRRPPEGGVPQLTTETFPEEDHSWEEEITSFTREIEGKATALGTPHDALRALQIVYSAYSQSEKKLTV